MVIEVTSGSAKGKVSQIINNIRPNTSKEVVLFIERNGGGTVEKELSKQGVKVFRDKEALIDYAKKIPQH